MPPRTQAGEAIQEFGNTVSGILQDRFNAKQAEDFQQNEFAQFQSSTQNFYQGLGTVTDGNQLAQAFQSWQNNTFMPFLTQASAKYANNPRIMDIVKKVEESNRNGLANFMQVEAAGHELANRPKAEARAEEEFKLKKDSTEAEIGLQQAQAGYYNRMPAGGEGKEKSILDTFIVPPTASPAEQRIFAMDARFPEQKAAIDSRTIETAALKFVEQNRGKPRPDGYEFGKYPKSDDDRGIPSDVEVAADQIKRSANYRKLIEGGRIAHQLGPQSLHMHQGYYDDVLPFFEGTGSALLPEENVYKLKGTQSVENILSMALALPKSQLKTSGFTIDSMDNFIKTDLKNMESPQQMGPMISSVYDSAIGSKADGTDFNTRTKEPIKDYKDVVKALEFEFERRVTENLVEGEGSSREELRKLGNAFALKFARQKAIELGLDVPKNETALSLLLKSHKKAWKFAEGIIDKVSGESNEDEEELGNSNKKSSKDKKKEKLKLLKKEEDEEEL